MTMGRLVQCRFVLGGIIMGIIIAAVEHNCAFEGEGKEDDSESIISYNTSTPYSLPNKRPPLKA